MTETTEKSTRLVKVVSSDGVTFDVPRDVIALSTTINTLLQDLGLDDDEQGGDAIPVQNVTGATLKKVIEWCEYHHNDKEKDPVISGVWDNDFLNCDQGTIFELVLAANYLDVKGLLETCCQGVAKMIKGKTPEEIRRAFNIKNDFTPEEEDQIRKENAWCED